MAWNRLILVNLPSTRWQISFALLVYLYMTLNDSCYERCYMDSVHLVQHIHKSTFIQCCKNMLRCKWSIKRLCKGAVKIYRWGRLACTRLHSNFWPPPLIEPPPPVNYDRSLNLVEYNYLPFLLTIYLPSHLQTHPSRMGTCPFVCLPAFSPSYPFVCWFVGSFIHCFSPSILDLWYSWKDASPSNRMGHPYSTCRSHGRNRVNKCTVTNACEYS